MFSDSIWDPGTQLGVADLQNNNEQMRVYPNPAKDYVVCAAEKEEFINPKVELFNVLGEKMKAETGLTNGRITISTMTFSDGFYLVRITDGDKTYATRFMIER